MGGKAKIAVLGCAIVGATFTALPTQAAPGAALAGIGAISGLPVETVSFWGRPYPYGYRWGARFTYGYGHCVHTVRVETPEGWAWRRVHWCR